MSLAWTELALRNLACTRRSDELALALRHLYRLAQLPHSGQEFALHAQAVLERIRRELVAITDGDGRLLQPLAEYLGQAFAVESWTVQLFSEEVLRGRIELVVSTLGRKLDETLRAIAGLGHWQVASRGPGRVEGVVHNTPTLAEAQGRSFETGTIIVAARISGEEEIPQGVTAVVTESTVDLMSHVAVRARNAGVLLATCWDADGLASLRARQGQGLRLTVRSDGELAIEQIASVAPPAVQATAKAARPSRVSPTRSGEYAIPEVAFEKSNVGAKSRNLKQLRDRLPDWIHVPTAIALPYGACERVLEDALNRTGANRHQELTDHLVQEPASDIPATLAALRDLLVGLVPPSGLEATLRSATAKARIPWTTSFPDAWSAITRVWASKWNERAYFSRRALGIPDASLLMAVLIQEVVAADYAFVIHTTNPLSGDRDDLVAEIVLGLGETLVGNHPGHALGFARRPGDRAGRIISFPSKSLGLYGGGVIFRSDSSGEDLAGFAGAGLYDSIVVPQPRAVPLDYAAVDLLWNEDERRRLLDKVAELGRAVEDALGGPQDIEGAYAQGCFFVVQARPQVGLDHG